MARGWRPGFLLLAEEEATRSARAGVKVGVRLRGTLRTPGMPPRLDERQRGIFLTFALARTS